MTRMLALQRGAGNRAVTQLLLLRRPTPTGPSEAMKNRAEYEDGPVLYTKSTYYTPKEI